MSAGRVGVGEGLLLAGPESVRFGFPSRKDGPNSCKGFRVFGGVFGFRLYSPCPLWLWGG